MAVADNSFSMSTMFNALPYSKGISGFIPPPGFAPRASATPLHAALFNLMTDGEGVSYFKGMISKSDKTVLQRMASLLTSDSDYFMAIVTNKYGSRRVQKLLGKSADADALFCAAILRRFLHITTDKYASYVTIRAMVVFDKEMKKAMYEHILYHALDLACNQHGCIALNDIITDADDPYYRDQILDLIAKNARCLSNDASGNFVVQHVLTLYDLRITHDIAVNLFGHCVELSSKKYGSYIVEKLLEAEESMVVVVAELLECDGDRLMRLARNEFGNFVVVKALRFTKEMSRIDQFWGLVQKLMPFIHLLRRSHGSNIANILDSFRLRC
ncbi:Pumilio RNA-binding repeat [Arabidopsis suecica]|uniref:Pumilio RNA-binding repeat n=1 Tax=Arabidopsis suecica TaxID=45249 RepID=A0A8T1Y6E8_ARASU|nr:Pumilio RNA-binding repeat [Arabidopsis suecica]